MSEVKDIRAKCPHGIMVPNICDECIDAGIKRVSYRPKPDTPERPSTDKPAPREFAFSFVKLPDGFDVIWHADESPGIYPIEDFKRIHVVERSVLTQAEAEIARLKEVIARHAASEHVDPVKYFALQDERDSLKAERDEYWRKMMAAEQLEHIAKQERDALAEENARIKGELAERVKVDYDGGIISVGGIDIADHSELPKINEELFSKLARAKKALERIADNGEEEYATRIASETLGEIG